MSARYFCDVCEKQIEVHGRLIRKLGDVTVEVMHALKSTWNAGHICHNCIVEAVKRGTPVSK